LYCHIVQLDDITFVVFLNQNLQGQSSI